MIKFGHMEVFVSHDGAEEVPEPDDHPRTQGLNHCRTSGVQIELAAPRYRQ